MNTLTLPKPNPKQVLLFADRHKYIGYGGARGGGKSWGARVKAVMLALKYHKVANGVKTGIRILIVRKSYPELLANHITPIRAMLGRRFGSYNVQDKQYNFTCGSVIKFGYCETEKDMERYQGDEYDVIFLEEATQYEEIIFLKFKAILRGANGFPKRMYLTFNPGGVGHTWVRRLFIYRKFKPDEVPEEYSFIQSFVDDNLALMKVDKEYKQQLNALPEKLRQAWLYGNWDVFEGQYFEEFSDLPGEDGINYKTKQWTHVIDPFDVPRDWRRFRSFDWGGSKPFSCGWWAISPNGTMYRILELYGCTGEPNTGVRWIAPKVFGEIKRIEREHPLLKGLYVEGIADPSLWNGGDKDEAGISLADMAAKQGIYFEPGNNARIPGWEQVHYRLAFDDNGYAKMYFFNTCKDTIRTLPTLIYDKHKPEDLDSDGEDHCADEIRYIAMRNPITPPKRSINPTKPYNPLDTEPLIKIPTFYQY